MREMNRIVGFLMMVLISTIFVACGATGSNAEQKGKNNLDGMTKSMKQLTEKQNMINDNRGIAAIGVAIAKNSRPDILIKKARLEGINNLSEAQRLSVQSWTHLFSDAIGASENSEESDVFRTVINSVSSNLISGIEVRDFETWSVDNNTTAYATLVAIFPEKLYSSIMDELKKDSKSKEKNLYQRFQDSEASKEFEKKINEFKETYDNKY